MSLTKYMKGVACKMGEEEGLRSGRECDTNAETREKVILHQQLSFFKLDRKLQVSYSFFIYLGEYDLRI